jgi:hypothetical protein
MQLWHSEVELVVKSGFVYVPLLFDPEIAREIHDPSSLKGTPHQRAPGNSESVSLLQKHLRSWFDTSPRTENQLLFDSSSVRTEVSKCESGLLQEIPVLELGGREFIKAVDILSVLANYEKIDKTAYEQMKRDCLRKYSDFPGLQTLSPNGKLQTIILRIMPYFVRKSRGLERRQFNDEELLDLICSKLDIPGRFIEQAEKVFDSAFLLQRLDDLNKLKQTVAPLQEGPVTGEALCHWFHKALQVQIVDRERLRVKQELHARERFGESKRKHVAALLYLEEKGSFELDGFGFSRLGSRDEYLIYKRTGEYILKDYYARNYLFPDCRVAVSSYGPFRPLVIESYKHPFLLGHAPKQEICIKGYNWPDQFTAENIVRLLEESINALLYGYDARRRNGYHSLDPTLYYVKTIQFEDYRV